MCGRYVSVSSVDRLAAYFEVDQIRTDELPERYNVAPTLDVYSVIEREGERRLGTLHWGLVPGFSKDPKKSPRPINARVEGLLDKPMFRNALEHRRCLLPADGFYEWRKLADDRKQPYFIHDPDEQPLAFAGIWSSWRPKDEPDAERLYSCAIVTTAASGGVMPALHDRMPVVLPPELWDEWLADGDGDDADPAAHQQLLLDAGPADLAAYPVTTRVNNVRNDGADLVAPDDEPIDPDPVSS